MDDLLPIYAILAIVMAFAGVCFIQASRGEIRLPEWLFPVRGRWLRYLLLGIGAVLVLLSAPVWFCMVLPLLIAVLIAALPFGAAIVVLEAVARLVRPRRYPTAVSGCPEADAASSYVDLRNPSSSANDP